MMVEDLIDDYVIDPGIIMHDNVSEACHFYEVR